MLKLEEKRDRRLNVDNRRQQEQQPTVTSFGAHVVSTSTAHSLGVPISVPADEGRWVVARTTSSREFSRTGGASSDVEDQQRQSATAGSPLRTGAQLTTTPIKFQSAAEQLPGAVPRLPRV